MARCPAQVRAGRQSHIDDAWKVAVTSHDHQNRAGSTKKLGA